MAVWRELRANDAPVLFRVSALVIMLESVFFLASVSSSLLAASRAFGSDGSVTVTRGANIGRRGGRARTVHFHIEFPVLLAQRATELGVLDVDLDGVIHGPGDVTHGALVPSSTGLLARIYS